jgi:hypothetical protein
MYHTSSLNLFLPRSEEKCFFLVIYTNASYNLQQLFWWQPFSEKLELQDLEVEHEQAGSILSTNRNQIEDIMFKHSGYPHSEQDASGICHERGSYVMLHRCLLIRTFFDSQWSKVQSIETIYQRS